MCADHRIRPNNWGLLSTMNNTRSDCLDHVHPCLLQLIICQLALSICCSSYFLEVSSWTLSHQYLLEQWFSNSSKQHCELKNALNPSLSRPLQSRVRNQEHAVLKKIVLRWYWWHWSKGHTSPSDTPWEVAFPHKSELGGKSRGQGVVAVRILRCVPLSSAIH